MRKRGRGRESQSGERTRKRLSVGTEEKGDRGNILCVCEEETGAISVGVEEELGVL